MKQLKVCVWTMIFMLLAFLSPQIIEAAAYTFRSYDDGEMWFGSDGDYKMKFDSSSLDLEFLDTADNILASLTDDGTTGTLTVDTVSATTISGNPDFTGTPTFVDMTLSGDLAVNGGDLTSSAGTFNLLDVTPTTINLGGAATTLDLGAATGTTTIKNDGDIDGALTVVGVITAGSAPHILTDATGLIDGNKIKEDTVDNEQLINGDEYQFLSLRCGTDDTTQGYVYLFGDAATAGGYGRYYNGASDDTTTEYWGFSIEGDEFYIGPDTDADTLILSDGAISSGDATLAVFNDPTTITAFTGASAVTLGAGTSTVTIADDADVAGILGVDGAAITSDDATFALLNATPTTINAFGAATALNIASDTDLATLIGRARIGYVGANDFAGFAHVDMNFITKYAVLQSAAGETFINAATGQSVNIRVNNNATSIIEATATDVIIVADTDITGDLDISGDLVVDGSITSGGTAFGGLNYHIADAASTTMTISTQSTWTKFVGFNTTGGNAQTVDTNGHVTASTANSELTIGASGAGTYQALFDFSGGIAAGVNRQIKYGIAVDHATPDAITSSTDATPIVVTTTGNHDLLTGDSVIISGHGTNVAANGSHLVVVLSATTFELHDMDGGDVAGSGAGAGSGGNVDTHIHGNSISHRYLTSSNDLGGVPVAGEITLEASDTIYIVAMNHSGTDNLTFKKVGLRISRLAE
jgi:hypothetical protein